MSVAEFDGSGIARRQRFILAPVAALPDRTDGMNHMPGRKLVSPGDLGAAGLAAIQGAALGQQPQAGRAMDGAIDATTAEQGIIGGVDDGVNAKRGDVGNDDFEPRRTDLARGRGQAEAAALVMTPLSASSCCSSPAWNISRIMSQPPTNSPLT